MPKITKQTTGGIVYDALLRSKKQSRSSRVKLVIARIFAKRRTYANKRTIRIFDLEDADSDWH